MHKSEVTLPKFRPFELTPAEKLARKLLSAQVSPTGFVVPGRPYCDDPVAVNLGQRGGTYLGHTRQSLSIEMLAPCRKCEKCLLFRQLYWRDRMAEEVRAVERTWFVTLTFSPVHLAGVISEAYVKYPNHPIEAAVELAAYFHVQQYLDRVRKTCGKFRYVAVPEYGEENGRLHYHLMLHETTLGSLTYRVIDGRWRSFVHAELVRESAGCANYVSKYLTKSFSRVRASQKYGQIRPADNSAKTAKRACF